MDMVEETESPRVYHLWSALAGISACLGRRVWLPFGHMRIWPNQFVVLVGNPATRKNTSMNIMKRMLAESTSVRFAPKDTGGQRQGIITALEKAASDEVSIEAQLNDMEKMSLEGLSVEEIGALEIENKIDPRDKHVLCVCTGEFSQFLGQRNATMLDFLIEMWDGEDIYDYKTSSAGRSKSVVLTDPMLSILGCTTPSSLVEALPQQAGSKGFLSRVILVYGIGKYKKIPRPKDPDQKLKERVKARFAELNYEFSGKMEETADARKFTEDMYDKPPVITDARFIFYNERRYTHFLKLGMLLAAGRGSHTICLDDYEEAYNILQATEELMPDALGEFGMSPIAAAKQTILEFLRAAQEPVTSGVLYAVMHRDVKMQDLTQCLNDLLAAGQIIREQSPSLGLVFMAKAKEGGLDHMVELMRDTGD